MFEPAVLRLALLQADVVELSTKLMLLL